jgi:short-subunit dehydrogenase
MPVTVNMARWKICRWKNARKQFETNFFGAAELTQMVLPQMRKQKSGRIINISSIGGDVYMPLGAYYHATKAALQQWSDVLDVEVKPLGIRSIIVQPGGTKSAWGDIAMDNAEKNLKANSPYKKLADGLIRTLK